jgi:hypothetical protein
MEFYQEEVFDELADRWGDGDACLWDGGASGGGGWRAVYRDRHLGWRRVMVTMQWLHQHFHPQEVET